MPKGETLMTQHGLSRMVWFCLALSGVLVLGCNSSTHNQTSEAKKVTGAGSTFINPIMSHWVADFQRNHPGIEINYQSIGSGGGIRQLKEGLVDFGASDAALDDNQLKEMPALVQIPESAGPVCITYNLAGLREPLKLSAATLAGIYLGKITTWRDPAIKRDNEGLTLPNSVIAVAHRSDGSGTTNIFTTYLSMVSPEWEKRAGKAMAINWPVGLGGKGSEGVTGIVKQTPGAIGYVELSYATENRLPVAKIQNQAGHWVEPSVSGATAAIDAFKDDLAKDVRNPVVNAPASAQEAYPIVGLTFLLVPKQPKDAGKGQIVKQFVQFIITEGQNSAEPLKYARLPPSLASENQQLLDQVSGNAPRTTGGVASR